MSSAPLGFSARVCEALRVRGESIIVTGGSGWLGRAVLEMLERALGDGVEARVRVFGSRAKRIELRSGRTIASRPLGELPQIASGPGLLLHFASMTRDRLTPENAGAFLAANERIAECVEAAVERLPLRGILFPSSGAAAGAEAAHDAYAIGKRRDEARFQRLGERLGVVVVAPRIFNLSGPFINKLEHYALGDLVGASLRGDVLKIRAAHRVLRSYVHVADLLDLALDTLLDDASDGFMRFDAAGEEAIEIGELARRVLRVLGRSGIPIERPVWRGAPSDVYLGDPKPLQELAARYGTRLRPLDEQIRDTASFLEDSRVGAGSGDAR